MIFKQPALNIGDYLHEPLNEENKNFSFECGDADINSYFLKDAWENQKMRKASTYVFTERKRNLIVAFFTISNSSVPDAGYELLKDKKTRWFRKKPSFIISPKAIWRYIKRGKTDWYSFDSREHEFPAILIARLGVHMDYQRRGIGSQILSFIKGWVDLENKSAFRLLILDSYNQQSHMNYYSQNGFLNLLQEDEDKYTRLLYFDMDRIE